MGGVVAFRVLGPVTVIAADGRVHHLGTTREAAVLADLLVHAGDVVSVDQLVDDIWRGDPPPSAKATLQTYVKNLRRLIDGDRGARVPEPALVTARPGYVLRTAGDLVDAGRAARLVDEGRRILEAGDEQVAVDRLREATKLWHGRPFGELGGESYLRGEASRLDELFIVATEERVEAELRLGLHHGLSGELESLAGVYPYRERLWGQLMLALYRSGRQTDALRAYQRVRVALGDEVGVEPGKALRALESAILAHDATLDWRPREPAVFAERPAGPDATPTGRFGAPTDRGAHGLGGSPLPSYATQFVGRSTDLKRLAAALTSCPLVTVTGVGGVGKTRTALEAARLVASDFPDGICFCELASADEASMLHAVAGQLGVRVHGQMPLQDAIIDWLQGRRFLLVLDNCEHVLVPVADLSGAITTWCPSVTVMTTSREAVNVAGEHLQRLSPLEPVEAAELFMDRARAAEPEVTDATDRVPLVQAICGSLDGIPLAIELAAARLRVMALADIAERVNDRFELLGHGPRNAIGRQQTLKATVQWSYDLLTDDERQVFDCLGVCVGGFDAAAAEAVSGISSTVTAEEILGSLVDKSMVDVDRVHRRTRYRLLETLRQFAEQQLGAKGRLGETRHRHLTYYAALAETGRRRYEGDDHAGGVAIFTAEWDNLRSAFRYAVDQEDVVKARIFLRALLFFSWMDARHELGDWAEQLIRAGIGDTLSYGVAAFFTVQRGAHDDGIAVAAQGLQLASHGGTDDWVCWYATTFGHYYSARVSEGQEAEARLDRAADARREPYAAGKAVLTRAAHAAMYATQSPDQYLEPRPPPRRGPAQREHRARCRLGGRSRGLASMAPR